MEKLVGWLGMNMFCYWRYERKGEKECFASEKVATYAAKWTEVP